RCCCDRRRASRTPAGPRKVPQPAREGNDLLVRLLALAGGLLGDARKSLAARQLGPYRLGLHTERRPQGQQVVENVGAFAHELGLVAADNFDQRLDGFLAQLLGDLLASAAEQAGRVGGVGIGALAPLDHEIEAVEHMLVQSRRTVEALFAVRLLLGFLVLCLPRGNSVAGGEGERLFYKGASWTDAVAILRQNHAAREICRIGTPAWARRSFACAMVNSPKWKSEAASTAEAPPCVTPSTR